MAILQERQLLSNLDQQFIRMLTRLSGEPTLPDAVALAAALVSHRASRGDVCLLLDSPLSGVTASLPFPPLDEWKSILRAHPLVGAPGSFSPLILESGGRLYLYRYWQYEDILARNLLTRTAVKVQVDDEMLHRELQHYFPEPPVLAVDWQRVAGAVAVLRRLCVISGGPGTGKTSTVVRILALLQSISETPLRIGLAAPTGKAAARLQSSIEDAKQQLECPQELLQQIPQDSVTLHRLLKVKMDGSGFHYHKENLLPLDLLVIDEASMVDLALMSKVVQALPAHARLIILGDQYQLASVEAGSVLGDICSGTGYFSSSFQKQLERVTGDKYLAAEEGNGVSEPVPLADSVVQLRHSYRFGSGSGIGRLADAINRGDATSSQAVLKDDEFTDLSWLADEQRPFRSALEGFRDYLQRVRNGDSVEEVFAAFERFRVLCAVRRGPLGVEGVNRAIEQMIAREGLIDTSPLWYSGRPVMITRNDYNLQLYNGDIGIALKDEEGQVGVCFFHSGSVRRVAPSRLPGHETSFAMTAHKSQGSEFDHVMLILPDSGREGLSRELLYTAVTRARRQFSLSGEPESLRMAVEQKIARRSGLSQRLL